MSLALQRESSFPTRQYQYRASGWGGGRRVLEGNWVIVFHKGCKM